MGLRREGRQWTPQGPGAQHSPRGRLWFPERVGRAGTDLSLSSRAVKLVGCATTADTLFPARILLGLPPSVLVGSPQASQPAAPDCTEFFWLVNSELVGAASNLGLQGRGVIWFLEDSRMWLRSLGANCFSVCSPWGTAVGKNGVPLWKPRQLGLMCAQPSSHS